MGPSPKHPHGAFRAPPGSLQVEEDDEVDGAAPTTPRRSPLVVEVGGEEERRRRSVKCEEEWTQTDPPRGGALEVRAWTGPEAEGEMEESVPESVLSRLSRGMERLFGQDGDGARCHRATQTDKDPLASETEKLAYDIVFFVLDRPSPGSRDLTSSEEVVLCLRRTVSKMLERHSIVFNSMVSRLQVDADTDLNQGFEQLSNELFYQGEV